MSSLPYYTLTVKFVSSQFYWGSGTNDCQSSLLPEHDGIMVLQVNGQTQQSEQGQSCM